MGHPGQGQVHGVRFDFRSFTAITRARATLGHGQIAGVVWRDAVIYFSITLNPSDSKHSNKLK